MAFLGDVAGALIGGAFSAFGAERANRAARAAAREQMQFQERMFKNRYRYTMADMEAAGLNPILAYKQGGGSAPGGSTYTPINIGAAGVTGAAGGVSSAVAARRAEYERALMKSQKDTTDTQGALNTFQSGVARAQRRVYEQQRKNLEWDEMQHRANSAFHKHLLDLWKSKAGKALAWTDAGGKAISPLDSVIKSR